MSVAISISPLSDSLDMYGEPDRSSAYSLSGHVKVTLTSPYSLFERRRTARFLLQSVSLTFEGQSEIVAPKIGYTSFRLCSISRELLPNEPVELTNEGREDSDEACHWNIIFNIPIPGWLPATSSFGVEDLGIRYGLYATAKVININETRGTPWSFTTLCSPFRSRVKSVHVQQKIIVRRFIKPPAIDAPTASLITYLVNSMKATPSVGGDKLRIPPDILSKIQVLASVPEYVNIEDASLPITLRLRTKDLEEAECKRLQVTALMVNLTQIEKCRYRPTTEYITRYPVPPETSQPPNQPLRDPHPISAVYDIGLYISRALAESTSTRSFSLLPREESGTYILTGNNYVFANDAAAVETPTWYTLETSIPFVQKGQIDEESAEWGGLSIIQPTAVSPLFGVRHDLTISVTCSYDVPDSEQKATERLTFSIPVCFTRVAPCQLLRSVSPPPDSSPDSTITSSDVPSTASYLQNLPAYSQLFDYNGDRKIDYSVPLPLYTPNLDATSSSSTLELDSTNQERKLCESDIDINELAAVLS